MMISLQDPKTDTGEHVALLELLGGVEITIMRAAMYSGAAQHHPHPFKLVCFPYPRSSRLVLPTLPFL
jgi:hypothetical protein